MEDVMRMAGKTTAHAVLSVCDGETLMPIIGYLLANNQETMERLMMDSAQAMAHGHRAIANLDGDKRGIVFIRDGYITLDSGKTDALFIDIRFASKPDGVTKLVLPYRHAAHADGFAVHRLKVLGPGPDEAALDSLINAFFCGLEAHERGGRLWREKYVDEAGVSAGHDGSESTDFTAEEFDALKRAPLLLFLMVAAADKNIDEKEGNAFLEILTNPEKFSCPLFNRLVTNIISDISPWLLSMSQGVVDAAAELRAIAKIVDSRLPKAEALAFKRALLTIGTEVAQASGGGLFGLGKKIGEEEQLALAVAAICLGAEPE